jgi:FkbM family methyltransferase
MVNLGRSLRFARRYRNWRELGRIRAAGGKPRCAVLRNGLRFESPADTNVLRPVAGVFFKHYYDPPGFEIGAADCVIDIGANVGTFSVLAARRTRGRVLAIEPHPENVRCLTQNLAVNGCDRVEVIACAVADQEGMLPLFPGHSGTTHQLFEAGVDVASEASIQVPVTTLQRILEERNIPRVDLLKLDCEGAEGLILPATPESTMLRIRRIAMEFHDASSPVGHHELQQLLEANGFATRLNWDGSSSTGMLYASR